MFPKHFDHSVFVRNGKFIVQEIVTLEDALHLMEEWPEARRDTIFEAARRACHAAWDGRYPLDAARRAFEGWARASKILESEASVLPWLTTPRTGRGGTPA